MPGYIDPVPPRTTLSVSLRDQARGKINLTSVDRISVDDIFLHLVRRELFKQAGGAAPTDDIIPEVKAEVVKDGFITR